MLIITVGIVSSVLLYLFIKPYTQTRVNQIRLFRWSLLLFPVSIILYCIVNYLLTYDKPESVRAAIELLQNNIEIKNTIGSYQSYSYYDKDLPKETDNPASFKLSMDGTLATLYITGKVTKGQNGEWRILTIKQDSIVKK